MRIQVKNILCSTDFSDYSNHGITYGIALAKEFGAKLYVCHVIDLSDATIYGQGFSDPVEQPKRMIDYSLGYLERLIGDQPLSFDWEPLIIIGHTGIEIARVAEEKKVDLKRYLSDAISHPIPAWDFNSGSTLPKSFNQNCTWPMLFNHPYTRTCLSPRQGLGRSFNKICVIN